MAKDGKNNVILDARAGDLPERFYIHSKHDAEDPEKVQLPTLDVSKDPFDLDALETGESSGLKEHVEQIKQQHSGNTNPIVVEEADSGAKTPMDDTPLNQTSEAVPDNGKEDIAKHLHPKQQSGESNPTGEPLDLGDTPMHTENPTTKVRSISVQDMPGRTFLMPPEKDGSWY